MKHAVFSSCVLPFLINVFNAALAAGQPTSTGLTPRSTPPKNIRDCDCFTVSGPDPGYFQHYKLWDFRSVPLRADFGHNTSNPGSDGDDWSDWFFESDEEVFTEEVVTNDQKNHTAQPEPNSLWFFKSAFDKDWASQRWQRSRTLTSPVDMVNSKHNVFFTRNFGQRDPQATYLVLRTTRHDNYTSTAEIETRVRNIYHCSLRVRLRILPASVVIPEPSQAKDWPPPDPRQHPIWRMNNETGLMNKVDPIEMGRPAKGACVGIFTYHAHNCEADIEFLTSDPPQRVRYANQPDYDPVTDQTIPGASSIVDLNVPWTTWATHRMDWLPAVSRWWVNDKPQAANAYQVPNLQSRLVINLWSDGGEWTGDMRIGESIYLGIEYIELAYNRTSDGSEHAIPPSKRHGGHQDASVLEFDDDNAYDEMLWEPDTETVTGNALTKKKKPGKCKKGRKGRKCRKKHKDGKKDEDKGDKDKGASRCSRSCNIDDFRLG